METPVQELPVRGESTAKDLVAGASRLGIEAAGRRWLVDLTEAGEIVPVPNSLTPVPLTQDWFRGLVNLRGMLHGVVDLGRFLGEAATPLSRETRLLVFGAGLNLNSGLLVSRTLGLRDVARWTAPGGSDLAQPAAPAPADWVGRTLRDPDGQTWWELSLRGLAADTRFLRVGR